MLARISRAHLVLITLFLSFISSAAFAAVGVGDADQVALVNVKEGEGIVGVQALGLVFFNNDTDKELWKSDGATASLVENLNTAGNGDPKRLVSFNGKIMFVADVNSVAQGGDLGKELCQSDGVTVSCFDLTAGSGDSDPKELAVVGGFLMFEIGDDVWAYDGTNPPFAVVGGTNIKPKEFTYFNGAAYFNAEAVAPATLHGKELWKWDLVQANAAVEIADIRPGASGSDPKELTVFNGKLYFNADDGTNGKEPYSFDGATAALVANLNAAAANSDPKEFTAAGSWLYFVATDGGAVVGKELWKYDGVNPPVAVELKAGTTSDDPKDLNALGSLLFFNGEATSPTGKRLWQYNGTTLSEVTIGGSAAKNPDHFGVVNNVLFFESNVAADGYGSNIPWWTTGGTATPIYDNSVGPVEIKSGGGSHPHVWGGFGLKVFFNAKNQSNADSLWVLATTSPADVTGTKEVTGSYYVGNQVTYTVVLSNASTTPQLDNPGDEFTDVLPAQVTLVSASATSGTTGTPGGNTVTWNGVIPGSGSVTITIYATINGGTVGQLVSNQGTAHVDVDGNGTNETDRQTNAAQFTVLSSGNGGNGGGPGPSQNALPVPSLSQFGLAILAVLMALGGGVLLQRRRV